MTEGAARGAPGRLTRSTRRDTRSDARRSAPDRTYARTACRPRVSWALLLLGAWPLAQAGCGGAVGPPPARYELVCTQRGSLQCVRFEPSTGVARRLSPSSVTMDPTALGKASGPSFAMACGPVATKKGTHVVCLRLDRTTGSVVAAPITDLPEAL